MLFLRILLEEIAKDRRVSEKLYEDVQMVEKSTGGVVCAAWVLVSPPLICARYFLSKFGGH